MIRQFLSNGPRKWYAGMATIALLGLAQAIRADDQLQPNATVQVGQQWDFDETGSQDMTMQVAGQQVLQSMKHARKGTLTVLTAKDGSATSIKVTFDPNCADSGSENGQQNNQPFPLAGKTVRVRKDDLGIVTIDGAATDDATTKELQQMLTPLHPILPKNAANVGDTWDGNPDATNKEFELGPNDTAEVKCKFIKVGTVDNRKTASVDVTGHVKKNQNGLAFVFDLKGTAELDLATGQTLKSDITGQTTVNGQTQGPQGNQVNIQGTGTMTDHQIMHLGGGDAGAPAGGVANTATGNGNPLGAGGGAADSPFTGDYKGDKLSASFASDGQGGLKGTIQMGDNKFPATAKIDSGKLTGSFTAQGTPFDFTATLNNGTMTLSSGGTDYVMTKAVANPLSGGGGAQQPKNPLGN